MRNIANLSVDISNYGDRVIDKLIEAQSNTGYVVQQDAKFFAPINTGEYKQSIKLGKTKYDGATITTDVYTDATVETKAGIVYNLGYLLENGTLQHAIPNAWGKGYTFGYTDDKGVYHKGTMDPDWHPGTPEQPHMIPALQRNVRLYKANIRKAMKEAE